MRRPGGILRKEIIRQKSRFFQGISFINTQEVILSRCIHTSTVRLVVSVRGSEIDIISEKLSEETIVKVIRYPREL